MNLSDLQNTSYADRTVTVSAQRLTATSYTLAGSSTYFVSLAG